MQLSFFTEPFAELDLLDAVERRTQQIQAATRFLNPGIVANAASLLAAHPTLSQPFATALLQLPIGDWPSVQDVATRTAVENDRPYYDMRMAAQDSNLTKKRLDANPDKYVSRDNPVTAFSPIDFGWRSVKGIVRGAFTAADSAFDEYANAPVRQAVRDYREEGLLEAAGGLASAYNPSTMASRIGSEEQGRSTLGILAKQYIDGEPPPRVNLGSGFLPSSDMQPPGMTDQQYQNKYGLPIHELSHKQREELQIGSRFGVSTSVSPGRLIFNNVVEPGTAPHNLLSGMTDIAWNIAADPTVAAIGPISTLRKASKTFRAGTGLIDDGRRLTIDGVSGVSFMNSSQGELVSTILANRNSLAGIKDILPDVKNRKLLNALRTATNPQQVKEIITPKLGTDITRVPYSGGILRRTMGVPTVGELASHLPFTDPDMARIAGFTPSVARSFKSSRIGQLPIGRWFNRRGGLNISVTDLDTAFDDVDKWMQNADFTPELREKHLLKWASIQDNNSTQMYSAARELMRDSSRRMFDVIDGQDVKPGEIVSSKTLRNRTSREIVRGVHKLFDSLGDASMHFVDEVGNPAWFPGTRQVGPNNLPLPTAHTLSEHLNSNISLPDPGDVFRVMRRLHKYGKVKKIEKNAIARSAEVLMTKVWSPMALLSGAWTAKVIADEQTRIWFAGLRSSFNDPLQFIAGITLGKVDPKNRLKAFNFAGQELRKIADDPNLAQSSRVINEYRGAMARGHNGYLGPQSNVASINTGYRKKYKGADDDYFEDWAGVELSTLANDPVVSRIAKDGVEEVKGHFWGGNLKSFRHQLSESMADPEDAKKLLEDKNFSDKFIESYNARLHMKTGGEVHIINGGGYVVSKPGHVDLLGIVRDGKYKQGDVTMSLRPEDANFDPSGLSMVLEQNYANYGPDVIKGVAPPKYTKDGTPGPWTRLVEGWFNYGMSKPTNFLSRSPAFDQLLWEKGQDLVPYLNDADRIKFAAGAKKAKRNIDIGVPRDDSVELTLGEAEELASISAAEGVKELLYDNARRLNWTEASRAIFPFGEAFVEMNTTWLRLLAENPEKVRRLQQGISAAREEGFITVDEEDGEQYYNLPGAGMLEDMFGIQEGSLRNVFTGSLDAMNPLRGGYFPGIGPMVQIPLQSMIPTTSDYDWARDMFLPYGSPEVDTPGSALEEFFPRSIARVWEAFRFDYENTPRQNGMVADVFNQLVLSGQYDITDPQQTEQLLDKSRSVAKKYDLIRAAAAIFTPGGVRFRQEAKDKKGEWLFVEAISEKYNQIKSADGEEVAEDWMMENFTNTIDDLLEGSTTQVLKRPLTETAWQFQRDHPEVYDALPLTGYYLLPDQPNDSFEYDAWANQLSEKDRVLTTPEEKAIQRQNQEAYEFRDSALAIMIESGLTPQSEDGRELMRMVDDYLKIEYPDYGKSIIGAPVRPDEEDIFDELRSWNNLQGPVTDSRIHQSITEFMETYDTVLETIHQETGFTTLDSTADELVIGTRQALYQYGEHLAETDPSFEMLWNDYLSRFILTQQDELGFEDDEPFDQLNRRLQNQEGMFSDTVDTADNPTVFAP